MKSRHAIVVLLLLSLLVVGVMFWPRGPEPCQATFAQVTEGMTTEQVIATVGANPKVEDLRETSERMPHPDFAYWWDGKDGTMMIYFDDNNRVEFKLIFNSRRKPEPTPAQRLLKRVGF